VYISAARLLNKVVVKPIDHTNESLAKITQGDLDELVTESDSVEFASLSAGINTTVDALKGLINESERRMERDLATAKAIQESALPRTFPPFPEIKAFDIFATMEAAKEVGGDFYDFFLIDDHTLCFLIADVSGKGIPGALFMMAAKTEIENYLSTGMDPSEAIASANKRLCANNDAGMFVTVWAATLDYDTGLLTYVNAGHNFPLLRHGKNGSWEWLKKKCGLFLGTFETAKYRQETITLEPDDELLLYTDGVNEAFSANDEEFGNDRLESWLANHQDLAPEDLVRGLRAEVAQWAEGAEQSDDITILALEYGAIPEASGSITVTATLDHLYDVIDLVETEMNHRLCPVGIQHKVEIALEELFVNVCRYAYADKDEPGDVTVSYVYSGENKSITVELRDSGIPFNPVTLEDPTKPSDIQEAKIGGLGIFMVNKSMDDLVYEHDGDYNVVTFTKGW
jgi:sigma-B regulation protein RsbU (phosphoserine phosphatase)